MTDRRRRSAGALAALVVLALSLSTAACGDGDDGDEPGPSSSTTATRSTRSTSSTTVDTGATTSTPSSTTSTVPATSSTRLPVSTAPNTSVPADGSGSGSPIGTGGLAGRAGSQATAAGRYVYSTTGSFTAAVGGAQRRDGETVLVVDPPAQSRQRSTRQGPGGRSVEQTLEVRPDGLYAVAVKIVESGLAQEIRPSPPVLALPLVAPVGRTWSWKATTVDGRTTVDSAFRVTRDEAVTIGGDTVTARVIEVTITTSGEIVSTGRQILWYDPASRLIVRQQETTTGRVGLITFSSESTDTLRSLRPA